MNLLPVLFNDAGEIRYRKSAYFLMSISECRITRSSKGHVYVFRVKKALLNSVWCVMETPFSVVLYEYPLTWAVMVVPLLVSLLYQPLFVDKYGVVLG